MSFQFRPSPSPPVPSNPNRTIVVQLTLGGKEIGNTIVEIEEKGSSLLPIDKSLLTTTCLFPKIVHMMMFLKLL